MFVEEQVGVPAGCPPEVAGYDHIPAVPPALRYPQHRHAARVVGGVKLSVSRSAIVEEKLAAEAEVEVPGDDTAPCGSPTVMQCAE